jgi:hypothetical protein
MATPAQASPRLHDTDGFLVESPAGDLGWVEEVWLGDGGEPKAVAVRTADGRHGLLLDEDVVNVDREQRWVVVPEEPKLLELDAPRVAAESSSRGALAASWATTGAALTVTPRPHHLWHVPYRPAEPTRPRPRRRPERPVWQGIALLLATIAFLVAFTITLAYTIADLVTGGAY